MLVVQKYGGTSVGTIERITTGIRMAGEAPWMLLCSALLASIGLDVNSTAVIIGAMLISPLMNPILGIGLGVGIADRRLLQEAARELAIAALLALIMSTLYFRVSPLGEPTAELIARTNGEALPLTELISVESLRGFIPGRFRGESAVGATLSYRYPIWVLLDAELFLGVGNAFGPALIDFRFDRLVLDGGLALRLGVSRDTSIDLLVGFGTNRLGSPALEVDSFRFSFGAKHGF